MMHSILIVKLWYAFSFFTILFASPIVVVPIPDETVVPWPQGGFHVPIGPAQQSWYIFYNGTGCEPQECAAATELKNIWLSMIDQMISYLELGTRSIREPLSWQLPMPGMLNGHDRGYLVGVIEPHRQTGVERDELLVAMRNLRQQMIGHVVFTRFFADIYQGWEDLSATVFFGARLRDSPLENDSKVKTRWDANAMIGDMTPLNLSPASDPTDYRSSTDSPTAVQIAKRAPPVSNVTDYRPPWPIGRFKKPIGSSKDSWFDAYEATSMGPDDTLRRALWTELCDLIIQDMLDSPVDLVRISYVHEAKSPASSRTAWTGSLKVLFSPKVRGIEKRQVIAAMEDVKRLVGTYCCLAYLEVWMFEGVHDERAYCCFYMSVPMGNGRNSSLTGLPSNLVEGLQNIGGEPNADPVPAVDVT